MLFSAFISEPYTSGEGVCFRYKVLWELVGAESVDEAIGKLRAKYTVKLDSIGKILVAKYGLKQGEYYNVEIIALPQIIDILNVRMYHAGNKPKRLWI